MTQFPPHASYRASGLPWLKAVPTHWQETRLKREAQIQTGITLGKVYDTDLETRPYLRVANVQSGFLNLKHVKTIEVPRSEAVRCELRPNDVVLTEGGDIDKLGRGAIWTGEIKGCIHQNHIFAVRPNIATLTPKFLTYVLESPHGRTYFQLTAKQTTNLAATNRSTLGRFPLFLPPRPEQDQIIAYLRVQDAHIARYIKTKRELIALLTEQKQTIVEDAVTQGLNAAAAKRDSGLDWVLRVPSHWKTYKLKHIAVFNPSRSESAALRLSDDAVAFLPMECITVDGKLQNIECRRASEVWEGYTYFRRNDVVMAKITPCFENGKGGLLDALPTEIGFGTTEFIVLRAAARQVRSAFLAKLLSLKTFRILGADAMMGAAGQQRVPLDFVKNFRVALPPLDEQDQILNTLQTATAEQDATIARTKDEIKLIREYRDRLIADVVTGQTDVRGWQPGPDDVVNDEDLTTLGDDEEHEESAEEDDDGAD